MLITISEKIIRKRFEKYNITFNLHNKNIITKYYNLYLKIRNPKKSNITNIIDNVFKLLNDLRLTKFDSELSIKERFIQYLKLSRGNSLKHYQLRYGIKNGEKKFIKYKQRQAETNTFEYKHKKYGWTKEQFDEYNASRAVTKENLIRRHGETLGLEKWEAYCERQAYAGTTLEYFIEKYGENEGKQKYTTMLKKKVLAFDRSKTGVSLEEIDVLTKLYKALNSEFHKINSNKKEFQYKLIGQNKKIYYFDGNIPNTNILIEYQGDYWHANPKIYKADFKIFKNLTAKEKWQKDFDKLQEALRANYRVFIIWESDWRHYSDKIIFEFKQWMNSSSSFFTTLDLNLPYKSGKGIYEK